MNNGVFRTLLNNFNEVLFVKVVNDFYPLTIS